MIYFNIIKQVLLLKIYNIENKNIFYWCLLYESILIKNQIFINYFLNKINWNELKISLHIQKNKKLKIINKTNLYFLHQNDYNYYLTKIQ